MCTFECHATSWHANPHRVKMPKERERVSESGWDVCGGRCQLDRRYFSQLNRQTRRERGSIYRLCQKYPSKVPEIQAPQVAHLTLGPSATEGAGVTETLRQTFKVPCIPYVQYASQATGESKIPYDGLMAHQKGKKVPGRNSLLGS